jgi:hypothetical protein
MGRLQECGSWNAEGGKRERNRNNEINSLITEASNYTGNT